MTKDNKKRTAIIVEFTENKGANAVEHYFIGDELSEFALRCIITSCLEKIGDYKIEIIPNL